jgi:hypothetical protein
LVLLTPAVAVITTFVFEVTANVEIAKLAVVAPCGTVTLGGTDATEGFALESVTT